MEEFVELPALSSEVFQWLLAAATAVGVTIVLDIVRRILIKRLEKLSQRTTNHIDDIILDVARKTRFWFLLVIGAGIGVSMLDLTPKAALVIKIIFSSLTALQIG